jgi:tetratricopeptide (TPR) repeat protein
MLQEEPLRGNFRCVVVALIALLAGSSALAQTQTTLEVSETIFSVMAALNVCGYDQALSSSLPVRAEVRADLVAASKNPDAAAAAKSMCTFYEEHRRGGSQAIAPYVSLALNLVAPPSFAPKFAESDLPPDAAYVLGFVPHLKQYAAAANLHAIWLKHQPQYLALVNQFHDPVSNMIAGTDNYLRMPFGGYAGRTYTVYLEPMEAPGEINSRNYQADNYYMVVSPSTGTIHIDELRHTYLHYVLEPLLAKRATALNRLKPILASVQKAPLPEDYKSDMGLLLIESLIRAIEARTPSDPKLPDKDRQAMVNRAQAEGLVLTDYFYDQLKVFERGSTGLKEAFADWLHDIDVDKIRKQASETLFASSATPDVVQATNKAPESKVEQAEKALASGNPAGAAQLAQEALAANEDPARCYFVLARAASIAGEMQAAKDDFEKAAVSKDPRIAAWSHIYLGRILDLQDDRDAAVEQYKAALSVPDLSADAKAAAERGTQAPYEPPEASQQPKSQ